MTENKNSDDYSVFEEISKKYFLEVEHTVPHIQQTLFDLQNEYYKSVKHAVDANIKLCQEFLSDSGFKLPQAAKDIITNMGEESTKCRSMYNKLAIQNVEYIKNNVKAWNDNADAIVEMNHRILRYWFSVFSKNTK